MNVEKLKLKISKNKVSPKDILSALELDYQSTIAFLEKCDEINYDSFTKNDNLKLKDILKENKYVAIKNSKFASRCAQAYLSSLINNYLSTTNNVKRKKFIINDPRIGVNMFAIEALDFRKINDKDMACYDKVLNKENKMQVVLSIIDKDFILFSRDMFKFLECDNEKEEEELYKLLKRMNFEIKDGSEILLVNPIFMLYELENTKDIDSSLNKIKKLSLYNEKNLDSWIMSEKNLGRLSKILKKIKAFELFKKDESKAVYLKGNEDLNISLAGLGKLFHNNSYLTDIIFPPDESIIGIEKFNKIIQMYENGKLSALEPRIKEIVSYGYLANDRNFNGPYYKTIVKAIKKYGIPPTYLPLADLDEKVLSRLAKDKVITNEEIDWVKLMMKNEYPSVEEKKKTLDALDYSPKVSNLAEALRRIKNKNRSELSFEELNVIRLYMYDLLKENGIDNYQVSLFEYLDYNDLGIHSTNNIIYLGNGKDVKVIDLLKTVHHEVNHAIQYNSIKEINIDEDEDILEYSKDMVLRNLLDESYYKKNYYSMSFEFDADFKAQIQNAYLFGEEEKIFKQAKSELYLHLESVLANYMPDFNEAHQKLEREEGKVFDLKITPFHRNFIRNDMTIDELFAKEIFKLKETDSKKYEIIVDTIKKDFPIITYDYNLYTGKQKTIKELVEEMNKASIKDKAIYKCVIKSRCNEYKVGFKRASINLRELKKSGYVDKRDEVIRSIKDIKSKVDKYETIYYKLEEDIKNILNGDYKIKIK